MITKEMVGHIKDTLNSLTQGKNTNFGKNENATSAPEKGILVVLTSSDFSGESFTSSNQILASSTVIGTEGDVFKNEGTKTIDVASIPYSETISVVDNGEATGFAIVQVDQSDLVLKKITGSNADANLWDKYIINTGSGANVLNYKVLFSGELTTHQIIQKDNSFSLSNIKITFN